MSKYIISDEGRHYLDGILPTFTFPNRINSIRGAIKTVVVAENGDSSFANLKRLENIVREFLCRNGFGHDADYVFIIDEKGMELKECGSLAAFEEKENII